MMQLDIAAVMRETRAMKPPPDEIMALFDARLPRGWMAVKEGIDGRAYQNKSAGLIVISSVGNYDGRWWQHVSVSRRSRMPTYDDLALVKRLFVGEHAMALQVFPKASDHVNLHPYCLHLWSPVDGESPLPDFTRGTGSI